MHILQAKPSLPPDMISWREPAQERSRRRFDQIIEVSGVLLDQGGLESLTMDRLAKQSGTSMGSLYHFFPERESILMALTDRVCGAMYTSFVSLARPENVEVSPSVAIGLVFPRLLDLFASVPGARAVLSLSDSVPAIRKVRDMYRPANAQLTETYLLFKFGHLRSERRAMVSDIFLQVCESLTIFVSKCDQSKATAAAFEAETMLVAYLESLVRKNR